MWTGGTSLSVVGRLGRSFAGGGGGTAIHGRFPISLIRPSLPPDRENPIRNSFSRSIPESAKSMVTVAWCGSSQLTESILCGKRMSSVVAVRQRDEVG